MIHPYVRGRYKIGVSENSEHKQNFTIEEVMSAIRNVVEELNKDE